MSKLLEIFGRGIAVDTADLIWHWLNVLRERSSEQETNWNAEDLDEAVELLGNRELDRCQEKIQFYLYEHPECARGRMVAVALSLRANDPAGAIEQLQSIYLRQPSNTMALYALGYCHERLGREDEAVAFYQDCIKFKSHLQLPRQRMAAIYFKNGRLEMAIREYEQLITEHPEDIASMVLLGYLYNEDHQFDRGNDIFNMAIVSHPDNFHDDNADDEIHELMESGQYERALESVQWLVDKLGEMPDLHVRMADILSRAGRTSEAILHYETALRLQPNYLEATIKLGTHYMRYQRYSLAAEQFNRAVEINDDIVDAYIGLAVSQYYGGHSEETQRTLSLAWAIQQNSSLLFSETAALHLQAARNEQNQTCDEPTDRTNLVHDVTVAHQKQMASSPHCADSHYKYGILMMVAGKLADAAQAFEQALAINPTHYRSRTKLALCLGESSQKDRAIPTLTDAGHLELSTLKLHYQTAMLYCDKPRFAQAMQTLQSRMKDSLMESDALVNVMVVLENLGLIDRATTTWERLNETALHAVGERLA
jgi:tetratricopeptide (TPR) repeat protein